jgi:hypothetical protein
VNVPSTLLWGFLATLVMSLAMSGSQGLGLSRMSLPFILGTIVTPSIPRARIFGLGVHLVIGTGFAFLYAAVFESLGTATWWLGLILGFGHGLVMLMLILPLLPGLHPRMASETTGPDPTRNLEPPGFLALNYGRRTPLVGMLGHLLYGLILGSFYQLAG